MQSMWQMLSPCHARTRPSALFLVPPRLIAPARMLPARFELVSAIDEELTDRFRSSKLSTFATSRGLECA
jgi:hypothetical protein